jgi:hypothetical protein
MNLLQATTIPFVIQFSAILPKTPRKLKREATAKTPRSQRGLRPQSEHTDFEQEQTESAETEATLGSLGYLLFKKCVPGARTLIVCSGKVIRFATFAPLPCKIILVIALHE